MTGHMNATVEQINYPSIARTETKREEDGV